jgi:hypothetical protein
MTIQPDYQSFLIGKMARPIGVGLTDVAGLPLALKRFQNDIVTWALRRGQAAVFAGTGLGKTLMQLAWAQAVTRATGKPVLVLAPLAVAEQTPGEADKFGITSVAYTPDHAAFRSAIVVTNYDRIEHFDMSMFGGIVLDESSIIKAHDSKTRARLTELCRHIPFKLCCTATPAPNDYVELGNHAEFLGVLTQKEMLATWFVHDGSMKAKNIKNHDTKPVAEWRLKGHAEQEFWAWVSSWAVMLRHPRELGYEEPGYDLPPLHKHQITVPSDLPLARTLSERLAARRASIEDRCRWAAELVNANPGRPWSIWCNMNDESALLAELIPGAVEVRGSDKPAVKKDRLLGFAAGRYPMLITKGSIAGFGLNFQVCADTVLVGLNDSFEQLYQLTRRHWRFGQTREVNAYLVASAAEGNVVANLEEKEAAADRMYAEMAKHTATLMTRSLQESREMVPHNQNMEVPAWLTAAA